MPPLDTFRPEPGSLPMRDGIPPRYKWDLTSICKTWDEWQAGYKQLDAAIGAFFSFQGTLAKGPGPLVAAFRAMEEMGAPSFRVWTDASLRYHESQRTTRINTA